MNILTENYCTGEQETVTHPTETRFYHTTLGIFLISSFYQIKVLGKTSTFLAFSQSEAKKNAPKGNQAKVY